MHAQPAHRYPGTSRNPIVTLTLSLDEFREHVEWLEGLDPRDGATRDWRAELDRIDPPHDPDDEP